MKDWSKREESYLIENAGRIPLQDLAEIMDRSVASIKQKTLQLNKQGYAISLRYKPSRTTYCPECGKMRGRLNRTGICRCCELNRMIQKVEANMADVLQKLSIKQREIYRQNDSILKSRIDPMPPLPALPKNNERKKRRMQEDYNLACEQIEIRNLERVLKARRRRYERMCEKFVKQKNQ